MSTIPNDHDGALWIIRRWIINKFIKSFNRLNKRKEKKTKKPSWISKIKHTKGQNTGIENKNIVTTTVTTTPSKASQVAGTKTAYNYKQCHSGNVALCKIGEARFYAGGWTRGAKSANCVVIDLTGSEYRWSRDISAENYAAEVAFRRTLESVESLNAKRSDALAWISMPIADYGVPNWTTKTWMSLAIDIFDILNAGTNVLIACTGGHGRTGLAISILLYLLKIVPDGQNPVDYVRKNYCDESIETSSQENYVYRILDLPYKANTVNYAKSYGTHSYWYGDDDYYGGYEGTRSKFGSCVMCNEYKWLTNDVCMECEEDLEAMDKKADAIDKELDHQYSKSMAMLGTCPYCGDIDVVLLDYNGDMICEKCQEWSKLRARELAKKYPDADECSYCGGNIDNLQYYYNHDRICEKCYIDLYATGLTTEIIDGENKTKIIVLRDPKIEKKETETK